MSQNQKKAFIHFYKNPKDHCMVDLWPRPWLEGDPAKTTAANFHLNVITAWIEILVIAYWPQLSLSVEPIWA